MVAPVPNDLPKECAKATKILSSFVDPVDGLDKLVPISVLARARGFALFSVVRVGLILSARAGSGIVIARVDTAPDGSGGHWTAPTAIGIAGLGGGFSAGAQIIDCLVVLNSAAAVRSFTTTGSLQLGGSLSIAVGPVGRSAEASGSLNATGSVAAMFSYSRAKGLYGGVSLEGTVLVERTDANVDAYGKGATAAAILSGRIQPPIWSRGLIDAIEKLTKTGHLANRLDRARQEEIDREYGAGLVLDSRRRTSYQAARRRDPADGDSSEDISPGPEPTLGSRRKDRDGSSSLWGESDDNDQDTLASLSKSSGRAFASSAAGASSSSASSAYQAPRRNSVATGKLFDDDFGSPSTSYSQSGFPQMAASRGKSRATPPPMNSEYVFGSSGGGSITNSPTAGRQTPSGRPSSSSGGRRTPGGSMSLFSRASSRTPAATDEQYNSYFDPNLGSSAGGSTPGSAGSKRPPFLRHRTRSSASKKSFSLVPAAFRRETPPVPGGSAAMAEEELERKLRLYDNDGDGEGDHGGRAGSGAAGGGHRGAPPSAMQRSYSASSASAGTPAYAGMTRRKTSPTTAAFPTLSQQHGASSHMGFLSSEEEDEFGSGRLGRRDEMQDTYEEALARDLALARRPSPSSSAWPRPGTGRRPDDHRGMQDDEDDANNEDLRRLEIIARRQRAILDAEERGENVRTSLDEFDRELQQGRAQIASGGGAFGRLGRWGGGGAGGGGGGYNNGNPGSNLARTLLSRAGSIGGGRAGGNGTSGNSPSNSGAGGGMARSGSVTLDGASSRKLATGREDPFAELYASQTGGGAGQGQGQSHAHNAAGGGGAGGGGAYGLLGRRLSSVRSSGETSSMFDSIGSSHAQSQITPASSVGGGLPQLSEDTDLDLDAHTGVTSPSGAGGGGGLVLALFPFQAQVPTDLAFAKGEVIRVTKRTASREDWWEGVNSSGVSGSFPANYTSDL